MCEVGWSVLWGDAISGCYGERCKGVAKDECLLWFWVPRGYLVGH